MVLVAGPPTMVASTVTFSAPCLRARSHVVLSCFCTLSHWTPGFGWIATYVTMVMVEPPYSWWLSCHKASQHPNAAARLGPKDLEQQPTARSSLRDGPGTELSRQSFCWL